MPDRDQSGPDPAGELVRRLLAARIGLLVGPPGPFVTTVIDRLTREAAATPVRLSVTGPTSLVALIALLADELRRRGLGGALDAVVRSEPGHSAHGFVAALDVREVPVLIVIENVDLLDPAGQGWASEVVAELGHLHRAVLTGTTMPGNLPIAMHHVPAHEVAAIELPADGAVPAPAAVSLPSSASRADALVAAGRPGVAAAGLPAIRALLEDLRRDGAACPPELALWGAIVAGAHDAELRDELLAQAAASATGGVMRSAVAAEQAVDHARRGMLADAMRAAAVALGLADAGVGGDPLAIDLVTAGAPVDDLVRARALTAVANVNAVDATPAARQAAHRQLTEASAALRRAGEAAWEEEAAVLLGYGVLLPAGDAASAAEWLGRAVGLHAAPDRDRAVLLTYLAEALAAAERHGEAEAAGREAHALGWQLGDEMVIWFACWSLLHAAARRGDAVETLTRLEEARRHIGIWEHHPQGFDFELDVADSLCRVGDETLARESLARLQAFAGRVDDDAIAACAQAVEAAFGGQRSDPPAAVAIDRRRTFDDLAAVALAAGAEERAGRSRYALGAAPGHVRERHLTVAALHRVVADDAATRGDLDDAVRHLRLAAVADPDGDDASHAERLRLMQHG